MRVVHVDAGREWRGGQRQLLLLAQRTPHVAVIVRPDAPARPRLEAAGVRVVPVEMRGRWLAGPLRRALAELAPDLVAAHDGHGAALALRCSPAPVVVHRRVDFAPSWAGLRRLRGAAAVVAVSGAVARVLPGCRVTVVHDGVEPLPIAGPEPEIGRPWALAAGALVPHKGHRHLVDALAYLPGWRLVIAGAGPLERRLRAPGVTLLGHVEDLGRWLAACDRFVHPSVEEGLGQVVLEAAFAGAPLVTTTAGGLAELGLGRACPPGDARALAEAIAAPPVRADPAALAPFTADAMAAATWRVYERSA